MDTTATPRERPPSSRPFWWLLGGCIALILGIAIVPHLYDGPAPDDRAMLPMWTSVPLSENGLAQFENWLDLHPYPSEITPKNLIFGTPEWDIVAAKKFVEEKREALDAFEKLGATNISKWQWRDGAAIAHWHQSMDHVSAMNRLSGHLRMKARVLVSEQHLEAAAALGFTMMRIGRGMQTQGGLFDHFVAMVVQAQGQAVLYDIVKADPDFMPDAQLRKQALTSWQPTMANFPSIMKVEYLRFKNLGEGIQSGTVDLAWRLDGWKKSLVTHDFRPHRTLRLYLDLQHPVFDACRGGWHGMKIAGEKVDALCLAMNDDSWWSVTTMCLRGNFYGECALLEVPPSFLEAQKKTLGWMVGHRILFCFFAIREFELATGSLPDRLEQLVPTYLPDVPKDPYTDGPLHWEKSRRLLYSVGPDEKDNGGDIDPKTVYRGNDLGMVAWWKSK